MEPIKKKKKKYNTTKLMSIFIAVIMSGSILGIIAYNMGGEKEEKLPENTFEYKGYLFAEDDQGFFWVRGVINGKETPVVFRSDPRNLSDIYITSDASQRLLEAKKVYIAYNPNKHSSSKMNIANYQLSRLFAALKIPVVAAFSEDTDPISPDIPVRECKNSKDLVPIIMLDIGDETKITSGDCVYVRGKDYDALILAADKLGMNLVGINV